MQHDRFVIDLLGGQELRYRSYPRILLTSESTPEHLLVYLTSVYLTSPRNRFLTLNMSSPTKSSASSKTLPLQKIKKGGGKQPRSSIFSASSWSSDEKTSVFTEAASLPDFDPNSPRKITVSEAKAIAVKLFGASDAGGKRKKTGKAVQNMFRRAVNAFASKHGNANADYRGWLSKQQKQAGSGDQGAMRRAFPVSMRKVALEAQGRRCFRAVVGEFDTTFKCYGNGDLYDETGTISTGEADHVYPWGGK